METLCILCCYCYRNRHHAGPKQQHKDDNQSEGPASSPSKLETGGELEFPFVHNNVLDSLKSNKIFEQFCEAIKTEQDNFFSSLQNSCDIDAVIVSASSNVNGSNRALAICPECLTFIEQAVEEKVKMDAVEVHVRKLQRQLLIALKELQDCVNSYQVRMRKINDVVRNSDISCLESCVKYKNKNEEEDAEEVASRRSRRKCIKNLEVRINKQDKTNGVFAFRENINRVVSEMERFNKDLSKRYGGASVVPTTTPMFSIDNKRPGQDGPHGEQGYVHLKEEVEDLLPPPPSPDNLMDWCPVEVQLQMAEEESDDMDESESLHDNDYDINEDVGSNFSDEEEFKPSVKKTPKKKKKKKKKSKSKKTKSSTDYLHDVDTSSWSIFKQRFVTKLLRKQDTKKIYTKLEFDPSRDYPMTFESSSGKLLVGGIQVIMEDEPQTSSGYLRCSQCPHQTKPASSSTKDENVSFPNMEKAMISHVLGHHLDVFRCSVCDKSLLSHWRFLEHMKGHQGKFTCDICGRPCATKDALGYHKWLHMSPEEQQEALRNGVKDPKRYFEKGKQQPKNSHVCATCGKGFQNPRLLKQHEDTHRTDREVIICPKCGKSMLKHSYEVYHKNHGCSSHDELQPNRVHCLQCNVSFKNKQFLRRHMIRVHSKEALQRNYVCELCSKRFKGSGDLKMHMKIHAEEKQWKCSKGCGKEFSVQRYWRRHELVCEKKGMVAVEDIDLTQFFEAPKTV